MVVDLIKEARIAEVANSACSEMIVEGSSTCLEMIVVVGSACLGMIVEGGYSMEEASSEGSMAEE